MFQINKKKDLFGNIEPADNRQRFYVQWHLTDRCNLRCKHCYQEDTVCKSMSYEDALIALDKLAEYIHGQGEFTTQINLTGGEPLLYPELFPLIDEIKNRNFKWALLTNGLPLLDNPKLAEEIRKRNPVFVQVSLEGGKTTNDEIRGIGTYEKIGQAMDILVSHEIKTLVSFTVNAKNYHEFSDVAKVAGKHKVYKLWCDRYVGQGELALSTEQYKEFLAILKKERKASLRKKGIKISAERSLQFIAGGNGYICGAGGALLVLLPDGTILPCRRLPLPLGNIFQRESVEEILKQSEIWQELTRPVYSNECLVCSDFRRCKGGAKCISYAQKGYFHGKDVNCCR